MLQKVSLFLSPSLYDIKYNGQFSVFILLNPSAVFNTVNQYLWIFIGFQDFPLSSFCFSSASLYTSHVSLLVSSLVTHCLNFGVSQGLVLHPLYLYFLHWWFHLFSSSNTAQAGKIHYSRFRDITAYSTSPLGYLISISKSASAKKNSSTPITTTQTCSFYSLSHFIW